MRLLPWVLLQVLSVVASLAPSHASVLESGDILSVDPIANWILRVDPVE